MHKIGNTTPLGNSINVFIDNNHVVIQAANSHNPNEPFTSYYSMADALELAAVLICAHHKINGTPGQVQFIGRVEEFDLSPPSPPAEEFHDYEFTIKVRGRGKDAESVYQTITEENDALPLDYDEVREIPRFTGGR